MYQTLFTLTLTDTSFDLCKLLLRLVDIGVALLETH